MRPRPDFVMVRLNAAGREFAGDGPLRIVARHLDYTFMGSEAVEVLLSEWTRILSRERTGRALIFEIAPAQEKGE